MEADASAHSATQRKIQQVRLQTEDITVARKVEEQIPLALLQKGPEDDAAARVADEEETTTRQIEAVKWVEEKLISGRGLTGQFYELMDTSVLSARTLIIQVITRKRM